MIREQKPLDVIRVTVPEGYRETCAISNRLPILGIVLNKLYAELGGRLVSVLLTGSLARGTASPTSDIDLCVLWGKPYSQRRRERIGEYVIDGFFDDVNTIKAILKARDTRHITSMYKSAIPIYDPHRISSMLIELAAESWRDGRRRSAQDVFATTASLEDRMSAILQCSTDDELRFSLLVSCFAGEVLETASIQVDSWGSPLKICSSRLRDRSDAITQLVEIVTDRTTTVEHRKQAAIKLYEIVDQSHSQRYSSSGPLLLNGFF